MSFWAVCSIPEQQQLVQTDLHLVQLGLICSDAQMHIFSHPLAQRPEEHVSNQTGNNETKGMGQPPAHVMQTLPTQTCIGWAKKAEIHMAISNVTAHLHGSTPTRLAETGQGLGGI